MAIIRNKIIFLVSQRKCFTTNKNTITLDYIIICRIYRGWTPLFTPLAVTKGVVPEPSTISRYRIRKHATKEILQEKGMQKAPLHIKKYIENAIPYKKPVGRVNLAYV